MSDPGLLPFAAALLVSLAMASAAALRAWNGWLALRREQLSAGRPGEGRGGVDLRTLRERVRRLEAIASGGDLAGL